MNILVCGANGQLGSDCVAVLSDSHAITGVDIDELDIADAKAVQTTVQDARPDYIINCAAYTNVDGCETDRETAFAVNADGARHLAMAAVATGARMIHVSTDYVFKGDKPLPGAYTESDPVNPVSVYGQSKADGEQAVMAADPASTIVRTAWLYGTDGKNFLKTMLRLALQNPCKPITIVADQFGSPTWSYTLARQIDTLIAKGGSGIYHATGEGYCSWHDFAAYFLKKMDVLHAITPCTTAEYPTPANRPANSILANQRLTEQGINHMQNWQDDVDQFVDRHRQTLLEMCKPG
ncbi:MAG: dTDP-4-dehydrorhamnose reductase [Thermodesulfobacteriota bacterium]|nr:dTDP-4-dehydrorhamnose reductase [Thermodesulfobacteriota bacterium]